MTWILKSRGDSTAPILRDFECPAHGYFDAVVDRDAETTPCPWCGVAAEYRLSPPLVGTRLAVAVSTGKSDERPPPHIALNTEALADGKMSPAEWHAAERQRNREARRRWIKRQTS